MDFSNIESSVYGNVEEDEDLLSELMALENEEKRKKESSVQKRSAAAQKKAPAASSRASALDPKALSEALAEIPDDDGNISDRIEDDEELLGELQDLMSEEEEDEAPSAPPEIPKRPAVNKNAELIAKLKESEQAYKRLKAAAGGNASKIRRYDRALATIADLTKKAERGIAVDLSEIPALPPGMSTGGSSPAPAPPARPAHASEPSPQASPKVPTRSSSIDQSVNPPPKQRTEPVQPEQVAPQPIPQKPVDSSTKANELLALLENRKQAYVKNAHAASKAEDKAAALEFVSIAKQFDEAIKAVNDGLLTECDESEIPPTPPPYRVPLSKLPPPKTLAEDLARRLEAFEELSTKYKTEGNDRKLRMNSRIVQNYKEAIREVRAGRPFDLSELPPPPGFKQLTTAGPSPAAAPKPNAPRPLPTVGPMAAADPRSGGAPSRQQNQLQFLLQRQKQFKEAAIASKQLGDVETAKKYLLSAKGFEPMIEASRNGLPVNISKAPIPPQCSTQKGSLRPMIESQKSLTGNENALIAGNTQEMFASMERDLIRQVKLCDNNRVHFSKLGDVSRVKLYESMLSSAKKDLLQLRADARSGNPPPRYRYETREFPCVDMNADLSEEVCRVVIVGADEVKLPSGYKPSHANIYVTYEFPLPHENHQTGKTKLVAGTDSPRFNESVDFTINRKSRQLQRVIKRTGIKFEVYQKGGFLRSDKLLGSAEIKIHDLETKATVDGIIPLMEGRKTAGGRIAVNVKIREPLGQTSLNVIREKWLVLVE